MNLVSQTKAREPSATSARAWEELPARQRN